MTAWRNLRVRADLYDLVAEAAEREDRSVRSWAERHLVAALAGASPVDTPRPSPEGRQAKSEAAQQSPGGRAASRQRASGPGTLPLAQVPRLGVPSAPRPKQAARKR